MNSATKAKIEAIANALLGVVSMVNPGAGQAAKLAQELAAATKLFDIGTDFSDLLKEVAEETDATAAEVEAHVTADYTSSRDRMLASFKAHPGK